MKRSGLTSSSPVDARRGLDALYTKTAPLRFRPPRVAQEASSVTLASGAQARSRRAAGGPSAGIAFSSS